MRLVLISLAALALAGSAAAETLAVKLDQSTRITVRQPIRDVVVGNPTVADVSLLDPNSLIVVGKSYGVTNLLIVDRSGRTVLDRDIVVSAPDGGAMSLFRGPEQRSFSCSPRCERMASPDKAPGGGAAGTPAGTP
jgi:Flp pilus assembly secretin CpaC